MSKKSICIFICLAMVCTLFVGCGNKEQKPADSTNVPEEGSDDTGEPTKFVFRVSSDPPTLDPQINNKSVGNTINGVLFEGMITQDENLEIQPAIAEKWEVSDDGYTYTFHLREDAKWSDGKPITTKDFEYAWLRALNPENAVKKANEFFYIKNAEAYYTGEVELSEVGFDFPDDHTIVIELENLSTEDELLYRLSSNVFYPLREDVIEANPDDWTLHPETCICSGPFKIKEYRMNEYVIVEKNKEYWDSDNKGKVDEIHFVFIDDSTTALRAFEAGEIDSFTGVPSEEVPRLRMESDEFHILPRIGFSYFALNVNEPPLDNPKVREALVLAIDKQAIADASVSGLSTPATGIVPPGCITDGVDFREEGDKNWKTYPIEGDIERAKAALAEAGYPNGEGFPKVEYLYNASPGNKQTAEMLQEMWKKNLNINIDLTNVEYKVESERRHSGQFQLARSAWNGSRFPMSFLQIFATGNKNNNPKYSNPEYDELIRQIRSEADIDKKTEMLHQAEDMALDAYIVCPIGYGSSTLMLKDKVKDLRVSPIGDVVFDYLYIEE